MRTSQAFILAWKQIKRIVQNMQSYDALNIQLSEKRSYVHIVFPYTYIVRIPYMYTRYVRSSTYIARISCIATSNWKRTERQICALLVVVPRCSCALGKVQESVAFFPAIAAEERNLFSLIELKIAHRMNFLFVHNLINLLVDAKRFRICFNILKKKKQAKRLCLNRNVTLNKYY